MAKQIQTEKPLKHPFPPVIGEDARVLIVGSFPSVQSRENQFYYGHPRNRFWNVITALFSETLPNSIQEKTELLIRHHIALWDVVASCAIQGSADSTLHAMKLNDVTGLVDITNVHTVFANGKKAGELLKRQITGNNSFQLQILPSTSPANAAWSLDRLISAWYPVYKAVNDENP